MKRFAIGCAAVCLTTIAAFAADPKIETAVKVFKQTEADAGKLKTFCEMNKLMTTAGDKEDATTDGKVDEYLKQLGPDFNAAWNAGEGLDENSPDGKMLNAALDELGSKCSA
jgi:hypothetical protein